MQEQKIPTIVGIVSTTITPTTTTPTTMKRDRTMWSPPLTEQTSSTSAEEDRGEQCLANNLREVEVAATADKEHIQKMTSHNDDLLKVVIKQKAHIDKQ